MQKKNRLLQTEQQPSQWQENLKKQQRQEQVKKYGVWAGIIALSFAGLAALVMLASNSNSNSSAPVEVANLPASKSTDIIIGDPKASVVITEYADFQCPACARANPVVNKVLADYNGKIKVVNRFFPLRSIHKNALISGQAAYASHKLGKFSEMKDLLYENQTAWENLGDPRQTFMGYAKDLGLKEDEFSKIMESDEAKSAVLNGEKEALGLGLNSTPTFFIGNKRFSPKGFDDFKKLIDQELK